MLHRTRLFFVRQKANTAFQGLFKRRIHNRRSAPDRGRGGEVYAGDTRLTEPENYTSGHSARLWATTNALQAAEKRVVGGRFAAAVGHERVAAMDTFANPTTVREVDVDNRQDEREMGLTSSSRATGNASRSKTVHGVDRPFDKRMIRALNGSELSRQRTAAKHPIMPGETNYGAIARKVTNQDNSDLQAEELRDKLASEHGIYGKDRIDAYMLDDETIFPNWVRTLKAQLRTKTMYGALGLTEADEVIRQNLLQLPADERRVQWARIKAAKSYELGEERLMSPEEIRNERTGKRKTWYLHYKRQNREGLVRRLAMKKPDQWGLPAVHGVDLSHRLSVVARHIVSKVKTQGQWPLDEGRLEKAKERLERSAARESFLSKPGENQREALNRVSPALREAMSRMHTREEERPVKRVSRRVYSFRLQAVKDGNQDEHGRKFMELSRRGRTGRKQELKGMESFELEGRRVHMPNFREGDRPRPFSPLSQRYDGKRYAFNADPRSGL